MTPEEYEYISKKYITFPQDKLIKHGCLFLIREINVEHIDKFIFTYYNEVIYSGILNQNNQVFYNTTNMNDYCISRMGQIFNKLDIVSILSYININLKSILSNECEYYINNINMKYFKEHVSLQNTIDIEIGKLI